MSKSAELKNDAIQAYLSGSTITEVADRFNVVPSTVFVWVKRYRDENGLPQDVKPTIASNDDVYTQKDIDVLYKEIMRKDIEIERLKKGYTTKGGGIEKEYAILSKKNFK